MGDDLEPVCREHGVLQQNYAQNDRQRAMGFEMQAKKCLTGMEAEDHGWRLILYTPDIRAASVAILLHCRRNCEAQPPDLFLRPEQFNLIDNMFLKGPLAQGAECGITHRS